MIRDSPKCWLNVVNENSCIDTSDNEQLSFFSVSNASQNCQSFSNIFRYDADRNNSRDLSPWRDCYSSYEPTIYGYSTA